MQPTKRRLLSYAVDFHADAVAELKRLDVRDRAAVAHVREKLVALGERLPFPHQSAVQGNPRLRELRPRAGRCRWRPLYAQVGAEFVILAVGPEAEVDRQGFNRAIRDASRRLDEIERTNDE
jgi:hypothetical protein